MEAIRLTTLSIIYYLKNEFHKRGINTISEGDQENLYRNFVPYFVRIIEGFPKVSKDLAALPLIAVDMMSGDENPFQIGGGWKDDLYYNIEIFARRDGERDDLADMILEMVQKDIPLLDFNVGNFPTYVYSDSEGILKENYGGNVPPKLCDIVFLEKRIEIPSLGIFELEAHRAVVSVRAEILR